LRAPRKDRVLPSFSFSSSTSMEFKMRRSRILVLLLSLLCGGCLEGGVGEGEGTDREGSMQGAEWHARPDTRIGSQDDYHQGLTSVGQVLIGPDGDLFISQPMSAEIRVYDEGGSLARTIGRRGEGPGEFGRLGYIGLAGDTLYAAEAGRVSYFDMDGGFLGSRRLTGESLQGVGLMYVPSAPQVFIPISQDEVLVRPGVATPSLLPSNETGITPGSWRVPVYRADSTAAVINTTVWKDFRATAVRMRSGGTVFQFQAPFDDSPLLALFLDGSGLVIVDRPAVGGRSPAFLLTAVAPGGDTLFVKEVQYDPIPLDERYLRRVLRRVGMFPADHSEPPDPSEVERELRNAGLIPSFQVPVGAIAMGQDGSIWLRREVRSEDVSQWQVFTRDGQVQGIVQLPSGARVVAAKDDVVVTVELDELDVPFVVKYRLERENGSRN